MMASLVRRFRLAVASRPQAIAGVLLQPNADLMVRCAQRATNAPAYAEVTLARV